MEQPVGRESANIETVPNGAAAVGPVGKHRKVGRRMERALSDASPTVRAVHQKKALVRQTGPHPKNAGPGCGSFDGWAAVGIIRTAPK